MKAGYTRTSGTKWISCAMTVRVFAQENHRNKSQRFEISTFLQFSAISFGDSPEQTPVRGGAIFDMGEPSTLLRGSRPVLSCDRWKSHKSTLSDRTPRFEYARPTGLTQTAGRPFSHERKNGREPRSTTFQNKEYKCIFDQTSLSF
jgi:hypothetical protein